MLLEKVLHVDSSGIQIFFFSIEGRESYHFVMARGWVNNDKTFIFISFKECFISAWMSFIPSAFASVTSVCFLHSSVWVFPCWNMTVLLCALNDCVNHPVRFIPPGVSSHAISFCLMVHFLIPQTIAMRS